MWWLRSNPLTKTNKPIKCLVLQINKSWIWSNQHHFLGIKFILALTKTDTGDTWTEIESHIVSSCFNRWGKSLNMNLFPSISSPPTLNLIYTQTYSLTFFCLCNVLSVNPLLFTLSILSLPHPYCVQSARGHFISCINNSPGAMQLVCSGCLKQAAALI